DRTWNRLQSQLTQSFNELTDQLGRYGHHPQLRSVDESSTSVITCDYQGQTRTMREFHHVVADELGNRERLFEEREREVIENHLIGDAAIELQRRIREGEDWVVRVNDQLEAVPTSSGIRLKFAWELADAHDDTLKTIRRLFLKTNVAWSLEERNAIGAFLQDRIRAERDRDDHAGWREHLSHALDYRTWHRFFILRKLPSDDTWKRLTKRTFGTGSGGEKAMTLTVPQFAAAAAHYQSASPWAPRLILLDEAFVAIDGPTRARLMGLLETFDLDYVMTSEREWGVYPTVSNLAIYHLASRPGYNAVAVTRWVWDGKEKVRDPVIDEGVTGG
ncbi:MAG: SbcC/MukB-like Walker B domain-containing protein, partial [Verrucomicrobiota bacterium]